MAFQPIALNYFFSTREPVDGGFRWTLTNAYPLTNNPVDIIESVVVIAAMTIGLFAHTVECRMDC